MAELDVRRIEPGESPAPVAGKLVGSSVSLLPVHPDDYRFLYWLATCDENAFRWRYKGVVPPFEQFVGQLNHDALSQFVVYSRDDSSRIGHVVCYAANLRDRLAFVGLVMAPDAHGARAGSEAGALFVEHLFRSYDLRKLYFEVPEFVVASISERILPFVQEEGRLREHAFTNGRYWDHYLYAVYSETWASTWPKDGDLI